MQVTYPIRTTNQIAQNAQPIRSPENLSQLHCSKSKSNQRNCLRYGEIVIEDFFRNLSENVRFGVRACHLRAIWQRPA